MSTKFLYIIYLPIGIIALGLWILYILQNASPSYILPTVQDSNSGCIWFSWSEQSDCEKRIIEGAALTNLVVWAAKQGNPDLCNTVAEWARVACRDIVYYELAMSSRQVWDCARITDKTKQSVCTTNLSPIVTTSSEKSQEVIPASIPVKK